MTPKAAAAQERDRILAYLRYCIDEEGFHEYQQLFHNIASKEHWDRWDNLDDEGQMPPGTKDPWG